MKLPKAKVQLCIAMAAREPGSRGTMRFLHCFAEVDWAELLRSVKEEHQPDHAHLSPRAAVQRMLPASCRFWTPVSMAHISPNTWYCRHTSGLPSSAASVLYILEIGGDTQVATTEIIPQEYFRLQKVVTRTHTLQANTRNQASLASHHVHGASAAAPLYGWKDQTHKPHHAFTFWLTGQKCPPAHFWHRRTPITAASSPGSCSGRGGNPHHTTL